MRMNACKTSSGQRRGGGMTLRLLLAAAVCAHCVPPYFVLDDVAPSTGGFGGEPVGGDTSSMAGQTPEGQSGHEPQGGQGDGGGASGGPPSGAATCGGEAGCEGCNGPGCEVLPDCRNNACSGFWTGTIQSDNVQATTLRFHISASDLVMVWFDYDVPACGSIGTASSIWNYGPTVVTGAFTTTMQSSDDIAYVLDGTFESSNEASGQLSVSYAKSSCESMLNLSWKASRVVCGDFKQEWPETCDDGNAASDACSDDCQLPLYFEGDHEPNDDGSPQVNSDDFAIANALGPFEYDTLVFGSLTAGDEDIFAVTNDRTFDRKLFVDTQGATMGTCPIQTKLRLRNAQGAGLGASTPFGLRDCARLESTLEPGQTAYLQLSQLEDEFPIAGYHLHLRFSQ
jgi:cysteine-rich repeat protein